MSNKLKYIFVAIFLLLVIGGGGVLYFTNKKTQTTVHLTPANRTELGLRNSDFARGDALINSNPSEALKAYQVALQTSTADADIDAIKFRIAVATYKSGYLSGDTTGGVALFKELIAANSTSNSSKAYAVQFLTQEWFAVQDQKFFDEIFSGEPYATFLRNSGGNKDIALQKLIAYGASFYKLPLLMLRLAGYKADQLLTLQNEEEKIKIFSEIKDDISQVERGVAQLKSPNLQQLPLIYNREIVLFGKLKLAGFDVGDPADAFTKGISYSTLYKDKNTPYFMYLNYAVFLAKQDKVGEKDKIVDLLKNIYSSSDTGLKILTYFRNEASAKDSGHDDLILLASLDPNFKDLLIKLGWKL